MKKWILLIITLYSSQSYAGDGDTKFNGLLSSGIPYVFRATVQSAALTPQVNIDLDYRLGILNSAFRGSLVFNRKDPYDALSYSIGFELGTKYVLTHSISLPYDWSAVLVEIRKQKYFDCCNKRVGWYASVSQALERRVVRERSGAFVETTNVLSPALALGLFIRVF